MYLMLEVEFTTMQGDYSEVGIIVANYSRSTMERLAKFTQIQKELFKGASYSNMEPELSGAMSLVPDVVEKDGDYEYYDYRSTNPNLIEHYKNDGFDYCCSLAGLSLPFASQEKYKDEVLLYVNGEWVPAKDVDDVALDDVEKWPDQFYIPGPYGGLTACLFNCLDEEPSDIGEAFAEYYYDSDDPALAAWATLIDMTKKLDTSFVRRVRSDYEPYIPEAAKLMILAGGV